MCIKNRLAKIFYLILVLWINYKTNLILYFDLNKSRNKFIISLMKSIQFQNILFIQEQII